MSAFAQTVRFLTVLTLATILVTPEWQASGQRQGGWFGGEKASGPNLPQLYTEIDKVRDNFPDVTSIAPMTGNLSMALNALWDEAWNTMTAKLIDLTTDCVVVGYAFRSHWMWHSNYREHCWVVWKDYNCGVWMLYDGITGNQQPSAGGSDPDWLRDKQMFMLSAKSVWQDTLSSYPPNIWLATNIVKEWAESNDSYANTFSTVGFVGAYGTTVERWAARFCYASGGNWGTFTVSVTHVDNINAPSFIWSNLFIQTRVGYSS